MDLVDVHIKQKPSIATSKKWFRLQWVNNFDAFFCIEFDNSEIPSSLKAFIHIHAY